MANTFEIDKNNWCQMHSFHGYTCTRSKGHLGDHIAHSMGDHRAMVAWPNLSVKAVQAITMKPTARVPQPVNMYGTNCDCGAGILSSTPIPSGKQCAKCESKAILATVPRAALAQPSRRELAESLLKTMVEWDMRSCTVKQQREFLDAIRMLKREAKS